MTSPAALVKVWRGEVVESIHYGHVAIIGKKGELLYSLGDPEFLTYLRSCAKPFQALPIVESGAGERFGFSPRELACFCGSLNGQDYQVETLKNIATRIGVGEEHLQCGTHRPSHAPTARQMDKAGLKPTPFHNNCAGKHLCMLALCRFYEWPVENYMAVDHPVQVLMRRTVAEMMEVAPESLFIGVDGCGVPVFAAPLSALARGYKNLALFFNRGANTREQATARLMRAALAHPEMIAGDERICTEAMRTAPGRLFAKTGAEGSYGLALMEKDWGVALKIADGGARALAPAAMEILHRLGIISEENLSRLRSFHRPDLFNHRKERVGFLDPDIPIPPLTA